MLLRDPPTVLDIAGARAALEQAHELEAPVAGVDLHARHARPARSRLQEARRPAVRSFTSGPSAAGGRGLSGGRGSPARRPGGRVAVARSARENGAAWRSPEAEIALRNPDDPVLACEAACRASRGVLAAARARPRTDRRGAARRARCVTSAMATDSEVPERFRAVAAWARRGPCCCTATTSAFRKPCASRPRPGRSLPRRLRCGTCSRSGIAGSASSAGRRRRRNGSGGPSPGPPIPRTSGPGRWPRRAAGAIGWLSCSPRPSSVTRPGRYGAASKLWWADFRSCSAPGRAATGAARPAAGQPRSIRRSAARRGAASAAAHARSPPVRRA